MWSWSQVVVAYTCTHTHTHTHTHTSSTQHTPPPLLPWHFSPHSIPSVCSSSKAYYVHLFFFFFFTLSLHSRGNDSVHQSREIRSYTFTHTLVLFLHRSIWWYTVHSWAHAAVCTLAHRHTCWLSRQVEQRQIPISLPFIILRMLNTCGSNSLHHTSRQAGRVGCAGTWSMKSLFEYAHLWKHNFFPMSPCNHFCYFPLKTALSWHSWGWSSYMYIFYVNNRS